MRMFAVALLALGCAVFTPHANAQMMPLPASQEATPFDRYICFDQASAEAAAEAFQTGSDQAYFRQILEEITWDRCVYAPQYYVDSGTAVQRTYWNGTRALSITRMFYFHENTLIFIYGFSAHRGT